MAIDCSLPSDMNELQFEDLVPHDFDEDDGSSADELDTKLTNLGNMVSFDDDEDTLISIYNKLLAQNEIDGDVMADDVVTMWEPLEGSLTVRRLLESI
tara:strand:+ start:1894 stop:2187 length:294 start_codon:yes stop_codon:yes gene_type:complete